MDIGFLMVHRIISFHFNLLHWVSSSVTLFNLWTHLFPYLHKRINEYFPQSFSFICSFLSFFSNFSFFLSIILYSLNGFIFCNVFLYVILCYIILCYVMLCCYNVDHLKQTFLMQDPFVIRLIVFLSIYSSHFSFCCQTENLKSEKRKKSFFI